MTPTFIEYVNQDASGAWKVAESRVSLDSVVAGYWEGQSPEAIAEEFPSLSAEAIYGAIAYYLRNKKQIDAYMKDQSTRWNELHAESETRHGPLLDRIRSAGRPRNGVSS